MHFIQLLLAASCFTIAFSRPSAPSLLNPVIGTSNHQSQVSLVLLKDWRTGGNDDDDRSLTRKVLSGQQSTKQSSMKLQKRSGSLRSLQPEIIEHILNTAMNFMYQARRAGVAYTWCEVICMAFHEVITGYLHPLDPDKRFRHCQNFCDTNGDNSEVRREYTQYELILKSTFDDYSRQKDKEEGRYWDRLGGDSNLNFKGVDVKGEAGTVLGNLAAGFARIAGAVSKAGSLEGKSGAYMGEVHPFRLKGVP